MNFSRQRCKVWVATLVSLSMLAAACSSGSDASVSTEAATNASEPNATEPAATDDPDATAAPDDTDVSVASEPPVTDTPPDTDPPVELTATARGVTADTITIGYSYLDFDELIELGLSDSGWGDQELEFQTMVDDLNANGGINGRRLEVLYEPYSALGTENAEAVCLRLTEDSEVFAVVGGFLGPAEPANTCIVGRGNTVLVGGVQSEERLADAVAPWITTRPLRTRQADVLMTLLEAEGLLDDATVAVVASIDAEDVLDDVVASMENAGVVPVEALQSEAAVGDLIAENQVWAALAERIREAGANTVLLVGNPSAGIRNIAAAGLDVDIWALDQESLTALGVSADVEDARGTLTAAGLEGQKLWDHETAQDCRETFIAAQPDVEIIEPDDQQSDDDDVTRGLTVACRFLELFVVVAEAAGPNLTPDSFAAAALEFDEFSIVGQPFSSMGPDKFDSDDSFSLVSFNPDLGGAGGYDQVTEISDATPT